MLNVMRDNLRHLKWVLLIVALSMTAYLIPGFLRDLGKGGVSAEWAARVNDTEISTQAFLNAARSQDTYYRGLLGEQYSQLKPQLRLGTQVIQRLIYEQIQLDEARKLGFRASEQEIADRIINDPSLQDPQTGKFVGKDRYMEVAQRGYPGGVAALEKAYSAEIITRKWVDLVTQAVKVYPGDIRAVDGITFSVDAGEVFGFLGPNGAGKTTTIRILVTLLAPTSGQAVVDGHGEGVDAHVAVIRLIGDGHRLAGAARRASRHRGTVLGCQGNRPEKALGLRICVGRRHDELVQRLGGGAVAFDVQIGSLPLLDHGDV